MNKRELAIAVWTKALADPWTLAMSQEAHHAGDGTCACGHPAADHDGASCAGVTEIAPQVVEWCQCMGFTGPAPAGTNEADDASL